MSHLVSKLCGHCTLGLVYCALTHQHLKGSVQAFFSSVVTLTSFNYVCFLVFWGEWSGKLSQSKALFFGFGLSKAVHSSRSLYLIDSIQNINVALQVFCYSHNEYMEKIAEIISQSMTLTRRLSHCQDDETQLSWDSMLDRWFPINHRRCACKLPPVGSLSMHLCRCVTGVNCPRLWCTRAIYCHRKWDVIVCDSVVSVGSDLLLGLSFSSIGYETAAYEPSICESNSRCSSWTTKAGLMLLILTSTKHTGTFVTKKKGSRYCL